MTLGIFTPRQVEVHTATNFSTKKHNSLAQTNDSVIGKQDIPCDRKAFKRKWEESRGGKETPGVRRLSSESKGETGRQTSLAGSEVLIEHLVLFRAHHIVGKLPAPFC
jgi:hypothetical protein